MGEHVGESGDSASLLEVDEGRKVVFGHRPHDHLISLTRRPTPVNRIWSTTARLTDSDRIEVGCQRFVAMRSMRADMPEWPVPSEIVAS